MSRKEWNRRVNKKLHIEIFGRQYTLRGQNDQAYTDELVAFVDNKMCEISIHSPGSPFSKLAVLAAINIADELFQMRDQQKAKDLAINEKTHAIVENIEAAFNMHDEGSGASKP